MPDETTTYDEQYLLSKQLGQEIHSPQFQIYNTEVLSSIKEQETQFVEDLSSRGVPGEEVGAALGGNYLNTKLMLLFWKKKMMLVGELAVGIVE